MKAAVLYGREDVRVEDFISRPLRTGEVRVQIEASLTCGTDLKVFKRGYHQKMIETGPGVSGWSQGERVVAANSAPCGHCLYCRGNQENLCDDLLFVNGAYAESIILPARLVEK